MAYWTCELAGTTRVFDDVTDARNYAFIQLTIGAVQPDHTVGENNIHFVYNYWRTARIQPLRLAFTGNPSGHVVVITGVDQP